MTNSPFATPLMALSPFDFATAYMSSLALCGAGMSRQAAIMAHREDLNRLRQTAQPQTQTA
ncbi:hypothetical protein PQU92_18390 [Asticcacaulis sp. BYS171W]|uniref:Uncharacterized protein n=1 Tax=Asticcacaulis aquaticus TaxID=2984212 RepID=A0ABT5HYV2_9CAUL|nr:hypothetical protein [Asticcacaulis aquaticus]MDC7685257.1 hypothetical protein [Asticcacaulis aquaticus]